MDRQLDIDRANKRQIDRKKKYRQIDKKRYIDK